MSGGRQYAGHDISFERVLGSRPGTDEYFAVMEQMRLKQELKKVFADGKDVCRFCDVTTSGVTSFTCGRYPVADGEIRWLRVSFDARPVACTRCRRNRGTSSCAG